MKTIYKYLNAQVLAKLMTKIIDWFELGEKLWLYREKQDIQNLKRYIKEEIKEKIREKIVEKLEKEINKKTDEKTREEIRKTIKRR